ncbi:MAG: Amuc_1100 family pilus-like protein [Puniceicoccales bacterium]|jgi:hypothetical protein|nr:Amuc_1100 family pilus-like protein [Puniceicoccales bacterium]
MKNIIKKCIQFAIPVALCAAVAALLDAIWGKRRGMGVVGEDCRKIEAEIGQLFRAKWAPTEENLHQITQKSKAYDADYALYTSAKKRLKFKFFDGKKPENEVDLYFSLMSYVQFLAANASETATAIPQNFFFCFEPYVKKDLIPERDQIPELYKQSKIIAQLLVLLFQSNERGIELQGAMRESVDRPNSEKKRSDSVGTIDGSRWTFLRKNNLKSYVFTLDFAAYTDDLRRFINKLQEYNLPVIIRSLSINSAQKSGSGGDSITVTEKVKIALALEWVFIEYDKNSLKSKDVAQND